MTVVIPLTILLIAGGVSLTMMPKEYVKDLNIEKNKNYLDDLRKEANLKKGSVDKTGAAKKNTKPNVPDNHVTDLQKDLNDLGFIIGTKEGDGAYKDGVKLEPDGIFGGKTRTALGWFQFISTLKTREVNGKLDQVTPTLKDKVDHIAGENTKKEIKQWKEKGYKNPWDLIYNVELIKQTESDCHEICIQMLLKYNKVEATREEIARVMGDINILKTGPEPDQEIQGAKSWGLGVIGGANHTFQGWKDMLKAHGPLIVHWGLKKADGTPRGVHAVLMRGVSKDKGDESYVLCNNSWGQYDENTFKQFRELIEAEVTDYKDTCLNIYYFKQPQCSDTGYDT